jgi:hypothetical protein
VQGRTGHLVAQRVRATGRVDGVLDAGGVDATAGHRRVQGRPARRVERARRRDAMQQLEHEDRGDHRVVVHAVDLDEDHAVRGVELLLRPGDVDAGRTESERRQVGRRRGRRWWRRRRRTRIVQ